MKIAKQRPRKTTHHLVEGKIKTSLLRLAWPLLVGAFLHDLFNLVDLFFIGQLGSEALAALSLAGVIIAIIIMVALGISTGATALIAHYIGRRDYEKADSVLVQAVILSFICGFFMLLAGIFWVEPILRIMGATKEIMPYAAQYLQITFIFSVFIFLFFAFNQSLRGSGDTITPLKALVLANVLNIILDPLFIFGIGFFPRLEVAGSALATVISRFIGLLFLIRHFTCGYSSLHIKKSTIKVNILLLVRMVKIGFFSSLEVLSRQISLLFLLKISSFFGIGALAAYGVVVRLKLFVIMFGLAIGIAAGILVGQSMGSNKPQRAQGSGWQAVKYYQMIVIPIALVFFIFSPQIISVFSRDPEVITLATIFLRYVSLSMPFLTPALVLGKAISGAGDTVAPAIFTGIFQLFLRIPLAYLLAKTLGLGVVGVYLAISASDFMHGVGVAFYFSKKKWQKRYHQHRNILEGEVA